MTRFRRDVDREVAGERVQILLRLAQETDRTDGALAQRYVDLAKRIVEKSKVRIPPQYKRLICKKCGRLIIPGSTSRIRLRQRREPHLTITCLRCQGIYRIPLRGREKPRQEQRLREAEKGRSQHAENAK